MLLALDVSRPAGGAWVTEGLSMLPDLRSVGSSSGLFGGRGSGVCDVDWSRGRGDLNGRCGGYGDEGDWRGMR